MSVQLKQTILPADTNQPDDKAAIPPLHNGDRLSRPMFEQIYHLHPELQPHFAMRLYGLPDFEANQPGFDGDGKRSGDHAGLGRAHGHPAS